MAKKKLPAKKTTKGKTDTATLSPDKASYAGLTVAISDLIVGIRGASTGTLEMIDNDLDQFNRSWLETGEPGGYGSLTDCCLADTDVADAIRNLISGILSERDD